MLELVEGPTLAAPDRARRDPARRSARHRDADRRGARRGTRAGHRASRSEAVEHQGPRTDGTVKVLDFGLAKAFEPSASLTPDNSQSPTLVSPAATRMGVIMGTAAYMSPEQARGRAVDKRADVWAFGCVVYEMLVGTRAFDGDDVSETIARVIEREPDWNALAAVAPPPVVRVVRRCLQKDPKRRLRDVADAVLELHDAIDTPSSANPAADRSSARSQSTLVLTAAVAAALAIGVLGGFWLLPRFTTSSPRNDTPPSSRLSTAIDLPADAPLALDSEAANVGYDSTLLDVSPDGRSLVYVGMSGGESRLFERRLDSFEVRPLPGTEGAIHPFFSPDGRWVGFLTNDKVKTYSFATGTTNTLGDVTTGAVGTWTKDDQIFVAADEGRRLERMSPRGGAPVLAAGPRDGFRYGRVTPDGRSALVTLVVNGIGADFAQMVLYNLATNESKTLLTNGYDARLTSTGHLVFGRSGRVFAARFNADREQIEGEPEPIASGVRMHALYPLSAAGGVVGRRDGLRAGRRCRRGRTGMGRSAEPRGVPSDRAGRLRHVRPLRRRPSAGHSSRGQPGLHRHLRCRAEYIPASRHTRERRMAEVVTVGTGAGLYELQRRKAVQNPDSTDRFGPPADRGCRITHAAHDEHVDQRPLAAHVLRVSG